MNVLAIVVPVFVLIAIGWGAVYFKRVSEGGQKGIAEFAFSFAIPALLFRTIATSKALAVSPTSLWLVYFGALFTTAAIAILATRVILRRPVIDAASIAMTSTYGNVVMLGLPLCLATLGPEAAAPMAVILSIHTPILWGTGTILHQWMAHDGKEPAGRVFAKLVRDLARNPLIVAIVLGGIWRLTGLGLPEVIDKSLALLGQAGVPCSLVALGMSLTNFAIKGQGPTLAMVLVLKLLVMPVLVALGAWGAGLSPAAAGVAILFAACPSGANAYLFAAKVERAVNSASGAVALGTALSAITTAVVVAVLSRG